MITTIAAKTMTLIVTANGSVDLFSDALNVGMYTDSGCFSIYHRGDAIHIRSNESKKFLVKIGRRQIKF